MQLLGGSMVAGVRQSGRSPTARSAGVWQRRDMMHVASVYFKCFRSV
jgi:hypothetical protein